MPFELPEGWAWARLPVISSEIFAGGDKPDTFSKTLTNKCDIPVFSNGIDNLGLYGYTDIPRVCSNSLTISARGTIGFCCVRTEPFFPIIRLITIVPCKQINVHYLNIVFKALVESGVGSSIPQLTVPMIRTKLIPLPPQREQESISNCYDMVVPFLRLIEKEKQNISEIIIQTKSKILDLAIHGKLVPQDENDEPASVLLERIRTEKEELIKQGKIKRDKKESIIFRGEDNSYYRDLPQSWELCSIVDVAEVELGKTLDKARNTGTFYPYLRSVNIKWNDIDLSDLNEMRFEPDEFERYTVQKGDLLICEGGDVGRCCVWKDEPILYQNALHRVRFYDSCNPYFFMYTLIFLENDGYLKRISNGVTIKHLTKSVLSAIPFPLPPIAEQQRIVEAIEKLFAQFDNIANFIS